MSWVEHTACEVDFVIAALALQGRERILDLACGFGRHSLELARRGYTVVGVDITPDYIDKARSLAEKDHLTNAEFICADLRDVSFESEFDVVLNLADGAIGYLETDEENLKIFDLIATALKPGGRHLMGVCSGDHARKHFPRRHWEAGSQSLSLADFDWDRENSRMLYTGYTLKYGEVLDKPEPQGLAGYTRLYTLEELGDIFAARGIEIKQTYGDYDMDVPASDKLLTLLVYSKKERKNHA
ncbi:MAG: class I SAM-dependent methyltransferase [Chloroflexi bacterium]|nr:class I SAM-dependent methyltransferase [Chloroflexota bacterium]